MGTDSLGRLIYLGDWVIGLNPVYYGEVGDTFDPYDGSGLTLIVFSDDWDYENIEPDDSIVDLAWSPERTNYERYFADLGTFEDIIEHTEDFCDDCFILGARNCPYYNWKRPCDSGFSCRWAFQYWLTQKATE